MIECMATFLHKTHHNKHLSATTKQVPNSTISCTNKTILLLFLAKQIQPMVERFTKIT